MNGQNLCQIYRLTGPVCLINALGLQSHIFHNSSKRVQVNARAEGNWQFIAIEMHLCIPCATQIS